MTVMAGEIIGDRCSHRCLGKCVHSLIREGISLKVFRNNTVKSQFPG